MVPVHYIVIQNLVIRQRLVIDADALYRQIGTGGVELQFALDVEIHLVQPFGGRRFLAVHIETDERPLLVRLRDRIEHVSDPDVLARLELRSHRVLIADQLPGVHRLGHHARQELGLLRGYHKAIPVAVRQFTKTGDQFGFRIRHVVRTIFDFQRHSHIPDAVADRLLRLVKRAVATIGRKRHAGTVAEQQAVFIPARTGTVLVHAPKHILKRHVLVTAYPGSGVVLRITTPESIERTDRVRRQRGLDVRMRGRYHVKRNFRRATGQRIILRFGVYVRLTIAARFATKQAVFLQPGTRALHLDSRNVALTVVGGVREIPGGELFRPQDGLLPVRLKTV